MSTTERIRDEHDHGPKAQLLDEVWCLSCERTHIASIPVVTFRCADCGFGSWGETVAEAHAARWSGHIVYPHVHRIAEHQPTAREGEACPVRPPSPPSMFLACDCAIWGEATCPRHGEQNRSQPAPVAPAGEVRQEGFVLRVPTDREPNDDGATLNRGRNYVDVQVVIQPDLDKRGEHRPGYGGSVIALREWDEQVFLHELLHVATGYAQPLLVETYPPHGHDVISRIEVALWETGWRWIGARPAGGVRLSEEEREALDRTNDEHDWPTETDDGLVMRCRCGATPPGHYLGQQVDEALWLWEHRRREQHAAVERILASRLVAAEQRVTEAKAEAARLREALEASEGEREDLDTGAGVLLGENVVLEAQVAAVRRLLRFEYVSAVDLAAALEEGDRG